MSFYKNFLKRCIDIAASSLGLVILSPLWFIVAAFIKIDSKGPIFFTQDRVGIDGEIFKIVKFRTMKIFEESFKPDGSEMENYSRITRVGRWLRKTSIDELPQLLNILYGDMSIVGPRPTLSYQAERYTSHQRKRLLVKPGLTGLAQVNGRNSLSWSQKIEYDIQYTKIISLITDIKIILKTLPVILKAEKQDFVKHDSLSTHTTNVLSDVGMVKQ